MFNLVFVIIILRVFLKAVSDGIHFALQEMSNAIKRSVVSTYLNVPEPLVASDVTAATMYPWRAFVSKYVCINTLDPHCNAPRLSVHLA